MTERADVGQTAEPDQQGKAGLEAVYRAHGNRLLRALVGFTGDQDVAADAVAEAFAQALHGRARIKDPAAWVWRVAFRVAAGELQRRRRQVPSVSTDAHLDPQPPTDLLRALAVLSRNQRGAVVLYLYAGYPVSEVATASSGPPLRRCGSIWPEGSKGSASC